MYDDNEVGRVWKEAVVSCIGVEGLKENHVRHGQDCRCPDFLFITKASGAYSGIRKTINTVLLNELISCNKCGYMFRLDIKLSSGHSVIRA